MEKVLTKSMICVAVILVVAVFLFASCNEIEYSITFVLGDDESVVWSISQTCPFDIQNAVPTPTKEGCTFEGWYADKDLQTPYQFGGDICQNLTLYAKWLANGNFDGVVFEDVVVNYDGCVHTIAPTNLPQGTSVSYSSAGYVDAGEYVITISLSKDGYDDATMSATLTINRAQIEGVVFDDLSVEWDGNEHSIFVQNLPDCVEVRYDNNTQSDVGVYTITASFVVDDNHLPLDDMSATLTIYKKILCVVFVNGDGQSTQIDVEYGDFLTDIPTAVSKSGYTHSWDFSFDTPITQNMTISVVYTPIEYTLVLHTNSSTSIETHYNIQSDDVVFEQFGDSDYFEFLGWWDNASFVGESVCCLPSGSVGDKEFYARWQAKSFAINYVLGDNAINDVNNPTSFDINSGELSLAPASCHGKVFDGWYLDCECTQKIESIVASNFARDLTLYAKWSDEAYSITYHLDGGVNDERNPNTYVVGDDFELCPPSREGYTFLGWYDEEGRPVVNLKNYTGDIVVYAYWQINE